MPIKEICKLPIKELADKDCVLFLWTTYPMLQEAMQVIKSWGFKYKTIAFQWIKKNKTGIGYFYGLGRWTRGNTEPCLLAVKGNPKRVNNSIFQIINSPIRGHSQKPTVQYKLIESLLGKKPRIELFARTSWEGWDAWGNQTQNNKQRVLVETPIIVNTQNQILPCVLTKETGEPK